MVGEAETIFVHDLKHDEILLKLHLAGFAGCMLNGIYRAVLKDFINL